MCWLPVCKALLNILTADSGASYVVRLLCSGPLPSRVYKKHRAAHSGAYQARVGALGGGWAEFPILSPENLKCSRCGMDRPCSRSSARPVLRRPMLGWTRSDQSCSCPEFQLQVLYSSRVWSSSLLSETLTAMWRSRFVVFKWGTRVLSFMGTFRS